MAFAPQTGRALTHNMFDGGSVTVVQHELFARVNFSMGRGGASAQMGCQLQRG